MISDHTRPAARRRADAGQLMLSEQAASRYGLLEICRIEELMCDRGGKKVIMLNIHVYTCGFCCCYLFFYVISLAIKPNTELQNFRIRVFLLLGVLHEKKGGWGQKGGWGEHIWQRLSHEQVSLLNTQSKSHLFLVQVWVRSATRLKFDWPGFNPWSPDHDRTFHVTEPPGTSLGSTGHCGQQEFV